MTSQLREMTLPIGDLFLDPNNPRFAEANAKPIAEQKIHQDTIQEKALQQIMRESFDVNQLMESIEEIGFLPVDRLVVVELPEAGKYMVVEGNRRLAAMKSLLTLADNGEIDLKEDTRASIASLPVLVIDSQDKLVRDHTARILQGVRHIASIKPWGAYQQAQFVALMLGEGKTMAAIKQAIGLSAQRINSLRRCYYAMDQMREDPEYGVDIKPKLFSHFEEALKQPALRTWLDWDDTQNKCLNDEHRSMFYSWCVGIEDDGERQPAKIVDSKDSRKLPALMADSILYKRFCEDPSLSVNDAARAIPGSGPQVDWRSVLSTNLATLNQVPALDLSTADVELLEKVKEQCNQLLRIANA